MIMKWLPSFIMLVYFRVYEMNQGMSIFCLDCKSTLKFFFLIIFKISKRIFTNQIEKVNEECKIEKDMYTEAFREQRKVTAGISVACWVPNLKFKSLVLRADDISILGLNFLNLVHLKCRYYKKDNLPGNFPLLKTHATKTVISKWWLAQSKVIRKLLDPPANFW